MIERPFVLMIAGPNGSGKTTFTAELARRGLDLGVYINPDEIASELPGSYVERVRLAQQQAEGRRRACIAAADSFSFETVMSHPSKIEVFEEARAAGFIAILYFISTEDPQLNVERVRQRVALGGHDVPPDRIVARYHRTMALLPAAVDAADRVVLFDNSYRAIAGAPVVLRPFLAFDRTSVPSLRVEHPVPRWGRSIVDHLQFTAIGQP